MAASAPSVRVAKEEEKLVLENFLWGIFNGITAWPLLVLHVFTIWDKYPVYNVVRDSGWYQFGFLIGAGSPIAGILTGNRIPSLRRH